MGLKDCLSFSEVSKKDFQYLVVFSPSSTPIDLHGIKRYLKKCHIDVHVCQSAFRLHNVSDFILR